MQKKFKIQNLNQQNSQAYVPFMSVKNVPLLQRAANAIGHTMDLSCTYLCTIVPSSYRADQWPCYEINIVDLLAVNSIYHPLTLLREFKTRITKIPIARPRCRCRCHGERKWCVIRKILLCNILKANIVQLWYWHRRLFTSQEYTALHFFVQ